jgi:protein TonB
LLISKLPPAPSKPVAVEVNYVEPEQLEQAKNGQKKAQADAAPTNQVVEQKDQINDELDEKTRFLSAFNQHVEKQTRAEQSGKFNNTAKGGNKKEEGVKADQEKLDNTSKVDKEVAKKQKAPSEDGDLPDLKDLSPKFVLDPGQKSADSKENGDPSRTDDYLQDVKNGMQTLLSSREFVYYTYYSRIKDAIRQHWEPDVRERVKIIYRQGRTIASAHDRITQVLVTLNSKGELIKVDVLNESGVEQLDSAAVEAFRSAAPFPNPPKGMVEADGTIKIRWDFVLEV